MRTAIIHPSRNKSFSRSSLRVCIFENSVFLDSRNSILASRNSNVSTFETRESSFEDRVETVNLHLTGTVIWQNKMVVVVVVVVVASAKVCT